MNPADLPSPLQLCYGEEGGGRGECLPLLCFGGVSILFCPPQEWGRQRKKADVRGRKRLAVKRGFCLQGEIQQGRLLFFESSPLLVVGAGQLWPFPPAGWKGWPFPGQDAARFGGRRKVCRRIPLADSSEPWDVMQLVCLPPSSLNESIKHSALAWKESGR